MIPRIVARATPPIMRRFVFRLWRLKGWFVYLADEERWRRRRDDDVGDRVAVEQKFNTGWSHESPNYVLYHELSETYPPNFIDILKW